MFSLGGTPANVPPRDAFCVLPLCEDMFNTDAGTNKLSDVMMQEQIDRMKAQIGESCFYFKTGFAGIFRNEANLERNFQMAATNNIALGVILRQSQTHALNIEVKNLLKQDIRRYQWRLDGTTWFGVGTSNAVEEIEYPARDGNRVTNSRYALQVRSAYETLMRSQADFLLEMDRRYPNVLAVVNAVIEEEMATEGGKADGYLADYSPFAITEFRDWLRHTGLYDTSTGARAGEGAPQGITGEWMWIDGQFRSPFYDDPSPADANGTGVSFNSHFGTAFSTWTLRYYDLDVWLAAIPYESGMEDPASPAFFDISPESGTGFTAGGFDAPRVRDPSDAYWLAWSWDQLDHDATKPGTYPPGDPQTPQYGFRQVMVRNWCSDVLDWAREQGVPADMLYAHQIPGEAVTASRLRSGATPIWTGYYEPGQTVGITRFGIIDPAWVTRYAARWGIFEWHPLPWRPAREPTYDDDLYAATVDSLESYYQNGARVLFPGWWTTDGSVKNDGTFPLADSGFARGIRDWLAEQPDQPRPDLTEP
jgi:hypothetical protein